MLIAEAERRAQAIEAHIEASAHSKVDAMETVVAQYKQVAREAEESLRAAECRAEMLKLKAETLSKKLEAYPRLPVNRSVDQWAELGREAKWKASQRERAAFKHLLNVHEWRAEDVLPRSSMSYSCLRTSWSPQNQAFGSTLKRCRN